MESALLIRGPAGAQQDIKILNDILNKTPSARCKFCQNEFIWLLETTSFSWLESATELILPDVIWNRKKLLFSLGNLGKNPEGLAGKGQLQILFILK